MKAILRNLCRQILDRESRGHLGGEWSTNLHDQFEILPAGTQGATVSNMWDLTDAGTTATPVVAFATDGGGLTLTTSAGDDDATSLWSLSTGAWSVPRKADGTRKHRLSSKVKTGASIASVAIQWGLKLTDTPVYKTDADQALIVFDTDAVDVDPASGYADISAGMTTFYVIASVAGSEYVYNTGVTVAAATEYDFAIEIGTDKVLNVFINGKQVALPGLPVLTSTASLLPMFSVSTRTTATKTATIRQMTYLGK